MKKSEKHADLATLALRWLLLLGVAGHSSDLAADQPIWKYEAPDKKSFHSDFISGARRQPNGNTLVCSGATGRFFEVSPQGEIVWEFREPFGVRGQISESDPDPDFDPRFNHAVFRITPISPDHPGIRGRDVKPLDPQPPHDTAARAGKK